MGRLRLVRRQWRRARVPGICAQRKTARQAERDGPDTGRRGGAGMARRIRDEDEENRSPWLLRFVAGAVAGLVLSVVVLAAISLWVLPPPERPADAAGEAEAGEAGEPTVIAGIEVAKTPAYMAPSAEQAESAAPEPEDAGPIELSGPALTVNAAPFEAPADVPLVALVIDNTAADPFFMDDLLSLELPVTVGVIAGMDGDRVTARRAREAGLEVVAELPLMPPGAGRGAELEYGLDREEAARRTELLLRRVPVAVAVSRALGAPRPPGPTVLAGIFDVVEPLGFGYVVVGAPREGPPPAAGLGRAVPLGIARLTVPAGASNTQAFEVLERAALVAAREGAAIVVASAGADILPALLLWTGVEGEAARLAPLSAVIRRQQGG